MRKVERVKEKEKEKGENLKKEAKGARVANLILLLKEGKVESLNGLEKVKEVDPNDPFINLSEQ